MFIKIRNIDTICLKFIALLIPAVLAFSISCDFRKSSEATEQVRVEEGKYSEPPVYDDSVITVIQATPEGKVLLSEGRREIYVVFNQPLVPLASLDEETKGVFTVSPSVKGKYRWYGSRICAFIPDEGWAADTEYSVKIPAGLKSLNDRKLKKDYLFRFRVEVPELGVRCYPYRSETINYDQSFTLTFTHPVKKDDLYKHLTIKSGKENVSYTLSTSSAVYSDYEDEGEAGSGSISAEIARTIIVKPQGTFGRNAAVVLGIRKGLRSVKNDAKLFEAAGFDYRTHGPFEVSFNDNASYFQELWNTGFHFTNYVDMKTAANAIKFSPHVDMYEHPSGKRKSIGLTEWKVKAGATYDIKVSSMTDLYGNSSAKPLSVKITVPDYYPYYSIDSDQNLLESDAGRKLPVEVINMQKFDVGIGTYTIGEIQKKLSGGYKYNITDNIEMKFTEWNTGLKNNQSGRLGYDASKYLKAGKYGWLAFRFKGMVYNTYERKLKEKIINQVIQATNLAVAVKEDYFTIHAWVSNLSDGTARKGIKLTVLDTAKEIGSGTTDGSGYCAISKKTPGMYDRAIFLASDGSGDRTYLTTIDNDLSMYGLASYSGSACERTITGEIIFDRKLYRPGDEVCFKGILAERFNGKLQSLAGVKTGIFINNSSGDSVYSDNITTSENGGIWGTWKIPSDAPLGHYQVRVVVKNGKKNEAEINDTFQVEEFRPVTFSVSIDGMKDARAGETMTLTIDGRYLFGAPMGNAPVKWTLSRKKKVISFDRFSGYSFGDSSYWLNESMGDSGAGHYSGGEGKLTGAGKSLLNVKLKPFTSIEKSNKPDTEYIMGNPYDMDIEATVKDVDDKSVTKSGSFTVYPGNFLIGIKQHKSYQSFKNEFAFDFVAVSNKGEKTSGRKCTVRVMKNSWKSVKSKGPEGSLQTRNTLVKETVYKGAITLSGDPSKFKFKPSSPGIYTITVQETGGMAFSRAGFYAYGGDFSASNFNDDDSVTQIPDKHNYRPGETAKVLVQSPFKNCKAIITLERETIYWRKVVTLDGRGTPVEIPVKEEYTPNVYLSVMLVRPRIKADSKTPAEMKKTFEENDLGAPKFKAGIVQLNISNQSKKAKLEVTTDKENFSPGEKMKIRIKTEPGAEVALSVADRGVLDLINYMYGNPLEKFYGTWALGVRIFHNLNMIIKQYKYALKGGSPGGSGDEDKYGNAIEGEMPGSGGFGLKNEDGTRKDIRYTAYWNPKVMADSNGYAEVEFKLPDNLTTFRIMAVAAAKGKFSAVKKEFRVRKAMIIQKNLPRFIRAGDKLFIGGTVINQTGIEGRFRVSIESDLLKLDSSAEAVVIKPGEAREILFPASLNNKKYAERYKAITDAVKTGNKDISKIINVRGYLTVEPAAMDRFTKAGFAESEVRDRLMYEFPVKEYTPEEAFTISGFTDGSVSEMINFPPGNEIFPEFGGLSISLTSTALVGINRGFSFYKSNPYFCLEQRASAFLLMISSGKLLKEFSFKPPDDRSYDFDNVEKLFLGEIGDFRNADGGFRLWKERDLFRGEMSDPYLTSYIIFVLVTARNKGYEVDQDMLNGAVSFLRKYMKDPARDGYTYILESLAFINYTFAAAGIKDDSISRLLVEKRKQLSLRANGFLALSLAVQRGVKKFSDDSDIKSIMDTFKNSMEITTRKIMFKDRGDGAYRRAFYSEGSTLALILQCYMRLDGDNPLIPGMVRHIIDSRGNSYWSDTHGVAFLSLALDEYREKYEKSGGGDMAAKVLINSRDVFRTTFSPGSLSMFTGIKSFNELYGFGGSGVNYPLMFMKEGGGRLYYTATLQYHPALSKTSPRDEGLEIRKTIYDLSKADEKNRSGIEVKDNLKRGEIYLCRIIVVNPKPCYNVIIVDPLPSSVEILNTSFATEKQSLDKYASKSGGGDYWWSYSIPVIEYRDDRVVIAENYLYPGMHEYTYLIRPIVRGKAGAPSATAKLMYEPEIFGRTGSGVMKVK
jgi:uncharacterized protein YfaS (alpha-2-macroglobulin family)